MFVLLIPWFSGGVDAELVAMLTSMSAAEQKWLMRMLLKDMKFGLGQSRIFRIYHPDAQELYDVSNNLLKVHNVYKVYFYLFHVFAFLWIQATSCQSCS
jgi:hypothetical protein